MLEYEDCRLGRRREKGQRGDECMHVKWTKEQEKEEEIHKAATVVIFDSN